jgi:two-component system, LytTR family, sensor kinase
MHQLFSGSIFTGSGPIDSTPQSVSVHTKRSFVYTDPKSNCLADHNSGAGELRNGDLAAYIQMMSRRAVSAVAALWLIPAFASAAETIVDAHVLERPMPFLVAVLTRSTPWLVWSIATPIVIGLVIRDGTAWPPRGRVIATHLLLCATVATLHSVVYTALSRLAPLTGPSPFSFRTTVWTELMGWSPASLLAYTALVGTGVALMLTRRTAVLRGALATAQLDALRAQIQPHFVFNVLNTIGVFVREGDRQRALRAIGLFGDTLRRTLNTEPTHLIALGDELEALYQYVAIEEMRYEDRVSVTWCIDGALLRHPVPALIYQPIVENAFRHGVGGRPAASVVEIGARADAARLTLWVREYCSSASNVGPTTVMSASSGIGLSNTVGRLTALYGSSGRMVLRMTEHGSLAEIEIPR